MARAQLIPNGDWETGAASGWTLTPGSLGGVCEVSSADPDKGKYHLRIGKAAGGTSSTATFSSPIATALVGYTLEFQVKYKQTDGNTGIADLSIQITDSTDTTTTVLSTGGGTPTSYTFGSVLRAIATGSTVVTFTIVVSDAADAGQYEVDVMVCDNPLLGTGVGEVEDLSGRESEAPKTFSTGWLDDLTKQPSTPNPPAPNPFPDLGVAEQGAVIYKGPSEWTKLPPGTDGQVLVTGGAAANPRWAGFKAATTHTFTNPTVAVLGGGGGMATTHTILNPTVVLGLL